MKLRNPETIEDAVLPLEIGIPRNQSRGKNADKNPSYTLIPDSKCDEETIKAIIATTFGISTDDQNFEKAFVEIVHGNGQELNRIGTLHSSALLSLLCFYNVSTEHPIIIEFDLDKVDKHITFSKVWFERTNYVENTADHPSNIDIVLASTDGETLLFLESKFTEPLTRASIDKIQNKYKTHLERIGYRFSFDESTSNKRLINGKLAMMYWSGIKQMIAHLLGIKTGPTDEHNEIQDSYREAYNNAKQYIIGTIIYDEKGTLLERNEPCFIKAYIDLYTECTKNIILHDPELLIANNGKEIYLITHSFSYQKLFTHPNSLILPSKVQKFYRLSQDN